MGFFLSFVALPLHAQRVDPSPSRWSLAVAGGGGYALSDVEIVPGTDQNGGWAWDLGLRAESGRSSIGVGYERLRFQLGPDGSATVSGVFAEPRFALSASTSGVRPYFFAHGGRVVKYDVTFCCSVYPALSNAHGWLVGGGFGVVTGPVGRVRFDLSAGVNRLSGKSAEANIGSWQGAGPLMSVRLGATVPLVGM